MNFYVSRTVTFDLPDSWGNNVHIINERGYVNSHVEAYPIFLHGVIRRWFEFWFSLKLLLNTSSYDCIAVGRFGLWVPILASLLFLKRRVVLMDVEWPKVKRGLFNRAASLGSVAVCCFTSEEIRRYSLQYRIPISKFKLVQAPFDSKNIIDPVDGGYIFAGGYQARDWKTFLAAVEGLPYKVRIFTSEVLEPLSDNVTIEHSNSKDYYLAMAHASCVVVPIRPEPMRITGMMTWANAMAMGKTVIVTEPLGATDYIDHGVSGYIVNYADVEELRKYIMLVMDDKCLRIRVGLEAKKRAYCQSSPEVYRKKILNLFLN